MSRLQGQDFLFMAVAVVVAQQEQDQMELAPQVAMVVLERHLVLLVHPSPVRVAAVVEHLVVALLVLVGQVAAALVVQMEQKPLLERLT